MLTREDFLKNIGHFCTMVDGSKGFICKTEMDNPRVLHNLPEKYCGWPYSERDNSDDAPESLKKKFDRAWNICDNGDARDSGVKRILKSCFDSQKTKKAKKTEQEIVTLIASIDSEPTDFQAAESKKTILDMTVKELLEKLDEIIKC